MRGCLGRPLPSKKFDPVLDLSDDQPSYDVPGGCSNCDWRGIVRIARGLRFGDALRHNNRCPHCGCGSVVRVWPN